jgi:hypothetical protein
MKFTSVLALVLTVAALIAVMTVAAPKSPNISGAADDSIYRPALWRVY